MRSLEGLNVAVIGSSGGVGRAVCAALAAEGANLVLAANDAKGLGVQEKELAGSAGRVVSRMLDVTDEPAVSALFTEAGAELGTLDALLNLAGLSITGKIAEMEADKYDTIVDVNVKGTFLASKHFIPCVDPDRGAQIINIGSMAAKRANPNAPLYCMAKAAVNMFSQGLALQLLESKVRVTTLNPGPIDSTFWGDRQVPREKFMKTADVAEVILFVLRMSETVVFHDVAFESFLFFK